MCDTMVALGNATKDGTVIFAKNSDRQPNEPQILIHIPRKKHPANSKVTCTYIQIDQVEKTHEIFIIKPSWIWGCEMGINEYGLTVGNEAVFTKETESKTGLIGMDFVRLALERCQTTEEAIDCITNLLTKYGQGGNCGYDKSFTYHNSFLIADRTSAWVLETAGNYWVAEKVKDVRSISNRLTIGSKFDAAHPDVIHHAIDKGWHKKNEAFHFANTYNRFLYTKLSGSAERYHCSQTILQQQKGRITNKTMKEVLRTHHHDLHNKLFQKFSVKSVCMHAGFLYGDQTTGSFIVSLNEKNGNIGLVTGSSAPCLSIFKPVRFHDYYAFFPEEESENALSFWLKREIIHRSLMTCSPIIFKQYNEERIQFEMDIEMMLTDSDAKKFAHAWELESEFVDKYVSIFSQNKEMKISGNPYFQYYWKKQNKKLWQENKSILESIHWRLYD